MTRLLGCLWVCCLLLSLSVLGVYAAEFDVNQDGTGDFTAIQDAIDAALDGDVIVVHPGTYYENIQFNGKNIVLRSVDPEDEYIVASTVIDGRWASSVVTFAGTEDETCQLLGFTITHGYASYGGGINGKATFALITSCTISGNSAIHNFWAGGGLGGGLSGCNGMIENCTISGNWAGVSGGGLCGCCGTIENCTISANSAAKDGGGLDWCSGTISTCTISANSAAEDGGGLALCDGTIENCTISANSADRKGGGLYGCDGRIENCTISANSAIGSCAYGGGLCRCSGKIMNCTISGNSAVAWFAYGAGLALCDGTIENCTISDNSAGSSGGGLFGCSGEIMNCTISGNSADESGGGSDYCNAMITNCIVWGNEAEEDPELSGGDATITYSCIRDWTGGGEGNISEEPMFVPGPLGDYYLSCEAAGHGAANSPCIDAGSDTAEALGLDELTTRTDCRPDTGVVDMGYHYPLTLDQNPEIECSLNESEFAPGDALVGFIEAQNPGPDVAVDVYVAFVLPDGAIISLTSGGLTSGMYPWVSNVVLPSGFDFVPTEVIRTTAPQSPGDYLFAAALTKPGVFEFVGEPSLFPFTITD